MKRPPSSSKPLADMREDWKSREAKSFRDVPGAPIDDQGNFITNLQPDELNGRGGEVMAAGKDIDDAPRLVAIHGGATDDWEKIKSTASAGLDLHAYRNKKTDRVKEIKTKQLDEQKQADSPTRPQPSGGPKESASTPNQLHTMSKLNDFKENSRLTEKKNQAREAAAAREQARDDKAKAVEARIEARKAQQKENAKDIKDNRPDTAKERVEVMTAKHQENTKDITGRESQPAKDGTEPLKTKFRDNAKDTTNH